MNKLVLIPLSRFEVTFDLASGQSYGEVHRRVLRAIGRRGASLEQLQEQFCLPARFLIESLINLFTEGWLTITADGFRLTAAGLKGVQEDRTPSFFQCATNERTNVMMELASGGLIRESAITYSSRASLQQSGDWEEAICMKSEFSAPVIDRAQVKPFIFHRKDQWIRNVSDAIVSSGEWHWLPVDVDVEMGTTAGLPSAWEPTLKQAVLDLVRERPDLGSERTEMYWKDRTLRTKPQPVTAFAARFQRDDLLFSATDHLDAMSRLLGSARGRVLVLSVSVGTMAPNLRDGLAKFQEKGGKLDLFGGKTVGIGSANQRIPELAGCGSNLVLHRDENGACAILGSFPWLDEVDQTKVDTSIVVRHPEVLALLSESAASLLEQGGGVAGPHSEAVDFWRNSATTLYDQFAEENNSADEVLDEAHSEIRLVRDQLHVQEVADLILTAQSRCMIASAVAESKKAMRTLSSLTRRAHANSVETRVLAGAVNLGSVELKEIDATLAPFGVQLRAQRESRTNVVLSDTSVLISSCRFLGGVRPHATEIGLLVDGGSVAQWVWDRLTSGPPKPTIG